MTHCGQIIVHSISHYSVTWWSDHRALHQPLQCHVVVRSSCTPSAITVSRGGQIIVQSISHYSATWWSDHTVPGGGQIIQCHVVVRSYGATWWSDQHSATWWSDCKLVRREARPKAQRGTELPFVSVCKLCKQSFSVPQIWTSF